MLQQKLVKVRIGDFDTTDSDSEITPVILTEQKQSPTKILANLERWEDLLFRNVLSNYKDGYYKGTLDLLNRNFFEKKCAFYDGEIKNGFPEDNYGKLTYHNLQVYEGGLVKGKRNGLGFLKTQDQTKIYANWTEDQVDGRFQVKIGDDVFEFYDENQRVIFDQI